MASQFPTAIDSLPRPNASDPLASPSHSSMHRDLATALEAVQAKVGINGSPVTTSLDYRIASVESGKAALAHTHVIGDIAGLQASLDAKAALSHTHTVSQLTDFPSQTGNAGKYLTTDGSSLSWATLVGGVTSVFGRTGAVTAQSGDYSAFYAPLTHGHVITDVSGLQTALSALQPLDGDLTAIAALSSTGLLARTANNAWAVRTITGTANQITVTSGDGISGNPTLALPQDIHTGASPAFTGLTLTGLGTITATALGTTQVTTKGLLLTNTTAAAVNAQQISPAVYWHGSGWKTAATAASQAVDFRAYVLPVQGAANPTGTWKLQKAVNGAAYSDVLSVTSGGTLSVAGLAYPYAVPYIGADGALAHGNNVFSFNPGFERLYVTNVQAGLELTASNTFRHIQMPDGAVPFFATAPYNGTMTSDVTALFFSPSTRQLAVGTGGPYANERMRVRGTDAHPNDTYGVSPSISYGQSSGFPAGSTQHGYRVYGYKVVHGVTYYSEHSADAYVQDDGRTVTAPGPTSASGGPNPGGSGYTADGTTNAIEVYGYRDTGQGRVYSAAYATASVSAGPYTCPDGGGASGSIDYGGSGYTATGKTWQLGVYPYTNTAVGPVYGSPAYYTLSDDGSNNPHAIDWSWSGVGADGYVLVLTDLWNYGTVVQDVGNTTALHDDNTAWAGGGAPTALSPYAPSMAIDWAWDAAGADGYLLKRDSDAWDVGNTTSVTDHNNSWSYYGPGGPTPTAVPDTYTVSVSWADPGGLDGYVVFKYDTYHNYNFDYYRDVGNTTGFTDDDTGWTDSLPDVSVNTYLGPWLYAEGDSAVVGDETRTGDLTVSGAVTAGAGSFAAGSSYMSNYGPTYGSCYGTWLGAAVGVGYGGTGNTSFTSGRLTYYTGSQLASASQLAYVNGGSGVTHLQVTASAAGNKPLVLKLAASPTANAFEVQNSAAAALMGIDKNGGLVPASMADSTAANNTVYYSTTASKLVYKSSAGVVNALY